MDLGWIPMVQFPTSFFILFISLGLRRYLTVTKIPELHSFSPIDFITSTEQWNQQWRSPDQACHNLYKLSMLSVCLSVCAYWIPTYSELRRTEPAKMDRTRPNRRYSFPPKWTEPAQTTLLPAKMDQPAKWERFACTLQTPTKCHKIKLIVHLSMTRIYQRLAEGLLCCMRSRSC